MASEVRRYDVAAHEAAHVVVGLACGLRLKRAVALSGAYDRGYELLGYAEFSTPRGGAPAAFALMHAAGIAWDKALREHPISRGHDAQALRAVVSSRHDYETMVNAAAAILATRMREHALITRALLDGDLHAEHIAALCRGETP